VPECPDKRINDEDWSFLYNYWKSSEFEVRNIYYKVSFCKMNVVNLYLCNFVLGSLGKRKSKSAKVAAPPYGW